jgi:multidrug efflux pump subunit AcrA (membrane-fusion protein)
MRSIVRLRSIFVIAIVAAAIGALWLAAGPESPAQGPKGPPGKGGPAGKGAFTPPPPKVLVTPARADTIAEPRTFVGTVMPLRRSIVGSAAPGRVEEYLVNEGDAVTKGQPIAHLRRGIIQAELDAAKGLLAVRQAELAELEKAYDEEMAQAQSKVAHAQAILDFRKSKRDRSVELGSRGAVSQELLQEDTSFFRQSEAILQEAQAALRMFTGGAKQMKIEQARAGVVAQQAEVQRLQEQFERHTMFAPFDGWVSAEHTEIGQWIMQGDPAAEIVELSQVDIEIAVVEDFVANLSAKSEAEIEIASLPKERFSGHVAIINPQADARARTFPVKIRVQNKVTDNQPLLKAGMFARVTLAVGAPTPCVVVPKDAVVLGGQTPMVFVADSADGKATVRPVPIKLGPPRGTWIAALGEIKPGETVIVEGNERVRPGMEVRPEAKEIAYP